MSAYFDPEVLTNSVIKNVASKGSNNWHSLKVALTNEAKAAKRAKQNYAIYLQAMYAVCNLYEITDADYVFGIFRAARETDIADIEDFQPDYYANGFEYLRFLSKEEKKLLLSTFGEPSEHRDFSEIAKPFLERITARFVRAQATSKNMDVERWMKKIRLALE